MKTENVSEMKFALAQQVRDACIVAATAGYESALMSGLCREGAWDAAISAIQMMNLQEVIS